jgi:hypothetical protein
MPTFPGLAIAPVFFGLVFWQQAICPQYLPWRQPISALVHGNMGWLQTLNFAVTGVLVMTFSVSLKFSDSSDAHLWCPVLIFGLGLVGCCIVPTDITGLEDAEALKGKRSVYGLIHDAFAVAGCGALYVACFFAAIWPGGGGGLWSVYSAVTGLLGLVSIIAAGAGFTGGHQYGGLLQRLAVGLGVVWLFCLAVRQLV